ncbi:hypothetical protein M422DRAFT_780740 [Sphaerobolus stellatus SS14]|uniref:BTB domain-containing protein n=1 Tax=Sphaerobolus stellatus (strain SS14) TaxID=990650 RepID=A0A0C9UZD9_SPHS4|nr:hypothetical protein M422DRAFT_780740 [Sphaerobolus stellatus SS14]
MEAFTKETKTDDIGRKPPFWHENGDIILSVKDAQANGEEHQFKVHKLILSLQSIVFLDMVELGGIQENKCPIVHLPGDSVQGVRALLMVLYKVALYNEPDVITFESALELLKLSHKYQFNEVYGAVIRLLKESWPVNRKKYVTFKRAYPKDRSAKCIQLISVARLVGANELLPTAFFELANQDLEMKLRTKSSHIQAISDKDMIRILVGQRRLIGYCIDPSVQTLDWNNKPILRHKHAGHKIENGCGVDCNVDKYFNSWKDFRGEWALRGYLRSFDVNGALMGYLHLNNELEPALCTNCKTWLSSLVLLVADEIWSNIPKAFDLPEIDPREYEDSKEVHWPNAFY